MTTNIDIPEELVALRDELFKRNPNYLFAPMEREYHGGGNRNYYEVYYSNEPDIRVGAIGYLSSEKKWWVSSCFKQGGRWISTAPDNGKTSIHMKSIVKSAPEMLSFPTLKEFMQTNYLWTMDQHIRQKRQELNWEMSNNTHGLPEAMYADFIKLADMGYKPISIEAKEVMDYLKLNYEKYKETQKYNPVYYHVWFKRSDITYQKCQGDDKSDEPKTVVSKADLPQTIVEKMAILDLLEVGDQVHDDLGVKGKSNFYSVFE